MGGNERGAIALLRDKLAEFAATCTLLVASVLAIFLLCVAVFNFVLRYESAVTRLSWGGDAIALGLLGSGAVLTVLLVRWRHSDLAATALGGIIAVAAAVFSALMLRPEWISDFQTMWIRAGEFASADFVVRDIYDQRIQLLLVPFVRIFGDSAWVVLLLNSICILVVLVLGARWAYRATGKGGAALFCISFATVPEILLAIGIPTHDVWALPFVLGIAVAMQQACEPLIARRWAVAWTFFAAVVMVLLQVQREIGHVAFVAALLSFSVLGALRYAPGPSSAAAVRSASPFTAVICAAALLLSYPALVASAASAGMFADGGSYRELVHVRTGGIVPSTSRGTYGDARGFADHFLASVPAESRGDLAQDIAFSDAMLQPERRIPNALHRLKTLSFMGSQTYFYAPNLSAERPSWQQAATVLTAWHAVGFALLSLIALLRLWRTGEWRAYLFPILFSSVLIAGLILVGEVQPRYLMPLWCTGALLIASLPVARIRFSTARWAWSGAYAMALVLAGWGAWRILDAMYGYDDGRILRWSIETDQSAAPNPAPVPAFAGLMYDERADAIGDLGLTLQLPSSSEQVVSREAVSTACLSGGGTFDFFYYMPYYQEYALDHFELSLLVDGRPVWTTGLPREKGVQHASVRVDGGRCMDMAFVLKTEKGLSDASWVNASLVDIYFTRFVTDTVPLTR